MKKIPLTQGKFALVDDCDFEALSQHKWYAWWNGSRYYARTHIRVGGVDAILLMHRVLLSPHSSKQVDHRDGDGLNNTRKNLRIATNAQNHRNCRLYSSNTSGFKGVSFHGQRKKWRAGIKLNGKTKYLGLFTFPEDAHAAYCVAAKKHYGAFARFK